MELPSVADATAHNSSFSRVQPGLQLAVDSTSLGAFKKCPRYYYYAVVLGYQTKDQGVHLRFGILMHRGLETYHRLRAYAIGHDDAVAAVVLDAMTQTWDRTLGRGEVLDSPVKHRLGLVRTLVDYLDNYQHDNCRTLTLSDGRAAVELSFRFGTGWTTQDGEEWLLCGHLDRLVSFAGEEWVQDVKTTGSTLSPHWFRSFTPDNQFSLYNAAGQIILERPLSGLLLDGVQVLAQSCAFARAPVPRPKAVVDEWMDETQHWLRGMETCAVEQVWPANDKSCGMYGGCEFRETCSRAPKARAQWLAATMQRRVWDPLVPR